MRKRASLAWQQHGPSAAPTTRGRFEPATTSSGYRALRLVADVVAVSVGIFVVSIVISMIAERGALRLAHQEFGTSRWGRVSVFVAGMAMSAVLAAVSVAVSGGPGSYGVIALVLLLGFDIVFCATEARADDNTRAQVDETEAVSEP